MSDKRVDILTTETLEGDTLTLHGITQAQTDQIIKNQNDITQLNTDLTNEIERAESKESELNSLISSEVTRAETKESELNSLISSETSRAESKESELTSLITSETSRAESKESELTSLISSETSRAETKESELTSLISSETSRAETKESELTSLISSETSRAESKESELSARLNSYQIKFNANETYTFDFSDSPWSISTTININCFGMTITTITTNITSLTVETNTKSRKHIDLFFTDFIPQLLNSNYFQQIKSTLQNYDFNSGSYAIQDVTLNQYLVFSSALLSIPNYSEYEDPETQETISDLNSYLRIELISQSGNDVTIPINSAVFTNRIFIPFKNLSI